MTQLIKKLDGNVYASATRRNQYVYAGTAYGYDAETGQTVMQTAENLTKRIYNKDTYREYSYNSS